MQNRVAIVEDDMRVRRSLAAMIALSDDMSVAVECGSAEEALERIPRGSPEVILMDIHLPNVSGIECVHRLRDRGVTAPVVMLTCYLDNDAIFSSLRAGACGYLLKPMRATQLLHSLRDVLSGGSPMSSCIARKVVECFRSPVNGSAGVLPLAAHGLTPREKEILQLLGEGYLYKEISEKLSISYSTVRTHIERVYEKLHVQSRAQAVAKAGGLMSMKA